MECEEDVVVLVVGFGDLWLCNCEWLVDVLLFGWNKFFWILGFKFKLNVVELVVFDLGCVWLLIWFLIWLCSVGILVVNLKGGVGKILFFFLMVGVFVNICGGGMIVFEVLDDFGVFVV